MRYPACGLLISFALAVSAAAADLDSARQLVKHGSYDEALESLAQLDAGDPEVALLSIECHQARGRYDEAQKIVAQALSADSPPPAMLVAGATLARLRGKTSEALVLADRAVAADPNLLSARWERVLALDDLGRTDDVLPELERFIDFYNDQQPTDADTLVMVARGAAEFARRTQSPDEFDFILNTVLEDARQADEDCWQARALAGELLLEKYNKTEAIPALQSALQTNPSAADVFALLAVSSVRDFDFASGFRHVEQALEINPRLVAAHCAHADLLILDERVDEAIQAVGKGLEVNPVSEEALGRLAACYYLQRKSAEAEALEKEVLARNPRPGIFYSRCGELLEQRRQFAQAEVELRKAIEASPHLTTPRNTLGMLLMRIGREEEAEEVFGEAFQRDPYHVRVSNMKKVLKHLDDYQVLRSEHYELKLSGDQDELLGPYMLEYLESVHRPLCERFQYEPKDLVKIEIMKSHQWFSARVVGLPSIGTVGACTGDVVALASPQGLPQSYNWARVLIHEVTHVITLQQTRYNIPHWYTEALAVMSEGYPRSQTWNELLMERVPKRDLLNLDTINHAFARPKTPLDWQMAYCQAQLYAEYMVERFGPESLGRLLQAYADGLPTEVGIRALFGVDKADFEKGYVAYLDKVVAALPTSHAEKSRSFPETERAYQADPGNADLAADLAVHYLERKKNKRARELAGEALAKEPKQATALYVLAKLEWSIGKPKEAAEILAGALDPANPNPRLLDLLAAIHVENKEFAQAAELYQTARKSDPYNPKWVEGLVRMYLKLGDTERLAPELEQLASMDADNQNVRQKLAEIAQEKMDWPAAAQWARESMHISIKPASPHRILALASEELKDSATAIREWEVLEKIEPLSWEESARLARLYDAAGDEEKARSWLERMKGRQAPADEIKRLEQEIAGA